MKEKFNLDKIKENLKKVNVKKLDIKKINIKNMDIKKVLCVAGVLVVLVAIIVTVVIMNNSNVDGITYNKDKDTYEMANGKVIIEDDFEISYNVVDKKYKISGTITNKTKRNYENLELTFEFYNQEKEVISSTKKTVKKVKANGKTKMEFIIDETSVLIYDYKIVDVKTK